MTKTFDWMPDRRRTPRVDLLAEVEGHLITLDERVQVRQLSLGGMTVETTAPLSPRVDHDFRISLGHRAVSLHARVVHARVAVDGDTVTYVAGLQFVDPTPLALEVVRSFVDSIRAGEVDE
ncbi:MAG: PilZ domain [Acidobacteria bacterium]|nr:PilZ domain [Acidobacteriota bacterium]